ncbi:MAG: magnesium transporter [Planctomycetes bacterium]|nr:magnesium transporter [Planctomycetota bacterium]
MADYLRHDVLTDPVVQHMRDDFVQLRADQTVAQAFEQIRAKQPAGRIVYFYLCDAAGRLIGVIPTRRLLLSQPDRLLSDIMVANVIVIPHTATVLEACEFFVLHRFLAFPIVDGEQRMIGLVDVDLYTQERSDLDLREESDTLFQLIGVHLADSQQASPIDSFRQRFPWLTANIVGGILAAFLAGLFDAELERAVALALFIPVVLALAESVCIQSVSLALPSLHFRPVDWTEYWSRLSRESITGLILGGACGLAVGATALGWIGQWHIALCIAGGVCGGVTSGACLGLSAPTLLRFLRRDPQVAAGPVALALTDMATLLIYLNLARWLLPLG